MSGAPIVRRKIHSTRQDKICNFFSDFLCFDMSLLFVTVTLRGVSNKHWLLSLFSFGQNVQLIDKIDELICKNNGKQT